MLPSNYGGDALANLLAGDANFSGKMPFTYPRLINALATYDYKPCENMGQMCSFISTIANKGGVVYLPQCYMYYFISPSQDSQHHEFFQYLSLIKFLSTQVEDRSILLNMRIFNIYNYLRDLQLKTGNIPYRRKALFLFYKYSLFNFFPKYILRLLKLYTK